MGWSTKTQNNRPWGWEQGGCPGACVPRSVVSPRSRPRSTKSWQPLGTAQLLVQVSGHPARPGVSESVLCVLTVISHEPYYLVCGRQEEQLCPGHSLRHRVPGKTPTRSFWRRGGAPSSNSRPRTQMCSAGTVAGHVPATCSLRARCLPCVLPVPRVPGSLVFAGGMEPSPERRCPCGLCQFQWVMSCPGGGGGPPQKLLLPGPGTQAWPGAPSQMETGRYCISPGGRWKAQPGPGHRYGEAV